MPGSPPTRVTEPCTSPPPSTRSSSPSPVERRSEPCVRTAVSGCGAAALDGRPVAPRTRAGSATISSTSDAPRRARRDTRPSQRGERVAALLADECRAARLVNHERSPRLTMRRPAGIIEPVQRTRRRARVGARPASTGPDSVASSARSRADRPRRCWSSGRRVLLLSSNNYLGLADHPALVAASCEAIRALGLRHRRVASHQRTPRPARRGRSAARRVQGDRGRAPLPVGLPGERRHDQRARRSRRPRLQRRAQPREHHRRLSSLAGLRPRLSSPRRPGTRGHPGRDPTGRPPLDRHRLCLLHGRRPGSPA